MQLQVFASSGPSGTALLRALFRTALHLLPLAGVGLGQGVSERSHSQTTEKRGTTPMNMQPAHHRSHHQQHRHPSHKPPGLRLPAKSSRPTCNYSSSSLRQDTAKASPPTSPLWADSITTASETFWRSHGRSQTATRVAGLYAWNQLGRKVMKGQKGNPHSCPDDRHPQEERHRGQQEQRPPQPSMHPCWSDSVPSMSLT